MSDDGFLDEVPYVNGRPMLVSREGDPLSHRSWAALQRDRSYKIVAQTKVGWLWVSTVWLGNDHAVFGPPQIFETMCFPDPGDPANYEGHDLDGHSFRVLPEAAPEELPQTRYATEAEAYAGHHEMVARAQVIVEGTAREVGRLTER